MIKVGHQAQPVAAGRGRPRLHRFGGSALVAVLTLCCAAAAVEPSAPRVLVLDSHHRQFPSSEQFVAGVLAGLSETVNADQLHIEFLDSMRFAETEYQRGLVALLESKYAERPPDLTIVNGDAALNYILGQSTPGAGRPIVFGGVTVFDPQRLDQRDEVTGVMLGQEIDGNIDLIARLHPNVERIIMVSDRSAAGVVLAAQAREVQIGRLGAEFELEIWQRPSLAALAADLTDVQASDVLLLLRVPPVAGASDISAGLADLTAQSKVPVYGMWSATMLGHGVTGGLMNDSYQHGLQIAEMAQRILSGQPPAELPIQRKARFSPRFDHRLLERFDIDRNRLPVGSRIAFEPASFWRQYWPAVAGTVLLVAFLIAVIAALLNANLQRQRAEASLRELNAELEVRVDKRTADLHEKNEQLQQMSEQMKHRANTDSLTELPNRRRGAQLLRRHLIRTLADAGTMSTAVVDLDHFKTINDLHGHQSGDRVLREVARRLAVTMRPTDLLCRWGGEEFLLVFPGLELEGAITACERLRQLVAGEPIPPVDKVTASFGVTELRKGDSVETLVKRADDALYLAKHQGRDRVIGG